LARIGVPKAPRGKAAAEQRKVEQRRLALAAVDARLAMIRETFSRAALGCLRGELDAARQVQAALAQVESRRAALRTAQEGA
jgi:hypothetical protein